MIDYPEREKLRDRLWIDADVDSLHEFTKILDAIERAAFKAGAKALLNQIKSMGRGERAEEIAFESLEYLLAQLDKEAPEDGKAT